VRACSSGATGESLDTPAAAKPPTTALLLEGWLVREWMVGNPEAIHLDVVANPWNGRGIWREHRSNLRALCGDSGSYSGHKLAGNQFRNIPSSRVAATHVPRAGQTRSRAVEGKPATRRTGQGAATSICRSAGLRTRAAFSRLRGGILLAASTGPRPRHGPEVNRLWCIL
jgi:hypothetical protein